MCIRDSLGPCLDECAARSNRDLHRPIGPDQRSLALGPNAYAHAPEADGQLERLPAIRDVGIDRERIFARAQAGESVYERLPDATHRCRVQAAVGGAVTVLEIEVRRHAQVMLGLLELTVASQQ